MAVDVQVLNGLVDRFLDGYSEDLVKQLRELRFYPGQAPVIDRLFREKDAIFEKFATFKGHPIYSPPVEKNRLIYREFLDQAEGFIERKVVSHLEELKKLILETQGKLGQRNRMSWEVVKANLNLLQTVSVDFLKTLRLYFREKFIPELVLRDASDVSVPIPPPSPGTPGESAPSKPKAPRSLDELLSLETFSEADAKPYDDSLTTIETWYSREKGGEAASRFKGLVNKLREGIAATMSPLTAKEESSYKTRLERGFVSLKDYRTIADSFATVISRLRPLLEKYFEGELKPLSYEAKDEAGDPYNKKIVYSKLFRNIHAHLGVLRAINQDVHYETAYYLYYKPAREHYLELKLIFEKVVLVRVPVKDKYSQDMKFFGLIFNDMRSQLEEFHAVLQKNY